MEFQQDNDNELSNWFEKSIENEEITYYDDQDFNNIHEIGFGGFSSVYSAGWKNTETTFAIKKFNKISMEIIDEVRHST